MSSLYFFFRYCWRASTAASSRRSWLSRLPRPSWIIWRVVLACSRTWVSNVVSRASLAAPEVEISHDTVYPGYAVVVRVIHEDGLFPATGLIIHGEAEADETEDGETGLISEEELLEEAGRQASALIVVNKRKTAAALYAMAPGKRFHLSTYMTAFDRRRVIEEVKEELSRLYEDYPNGQNVPENRRLLVISTSLIEAGVDLDFVTVYRELTGLDSILQAGGRCNREGKRQQAEICVFRLQEGTQRFRVHLARTLSEKYEDIASPECIREYYDRLYRFQSDEIRKNSIAHGVGSPFSIPFAAYAREFRMIGDDTVSVAVVCDEESRKLIDRLKQTGSTNHRRLQKYTFSVYVYELRQLQQQGVVKEYGGIWCLEAQRQYHSDTGLQFEAQDLYIE